MIYYNMRYRGPYEYDKFTLNILNYVNYVNDYVYDMNNTSDEYNTFKLTMHVYICELLEENLELIVHTDILWCKKDQLTTLDFAEADYKFLDLI